MTECCSFPAAAAAPPFPVRQISRGRRCGNRSRRSFLKIPVCSIYDLAYWFDGCVSLTTAEIPLYHAGHWHARLYGCLSLTTIMTYYGDSVLAEIGADAFYLPYDSGRTLYIGYLIGYPESTVPLHTYDWTGSKPLVTVLFMDV